MGEECSGQPLRFAAQRRTTRRLLLVDVTGDAAHVVKAYWDREKFPRPYMEVPGEAEILDFASVADRFPVFRMDEQA